MSEKVSITKSKLDSLANAIASVGETSVPKTIAQMESAVLELTIPPNLQSKTITPSVNQQIITPDVGYDGLSEVTVNAMPSGTAGTPTATKGTVSNHSISVTPSVTNTTGYITGSTIDGTPVTINVAELESGTKSITENGTGISVSGYSAVDVDVPGGGSEYTLLASQDFTVNTTSSTETTLGTISVGSAAYTSDKLIYIQVKDKNGHRDGYFYGAEAFVINELPAKGSTNPISTSGLIKVIYITGTGIVGTAYEIHGVYPKQISNNGDVTVCSKYYSSNYGRVNGTYTVSIYSLNWPGDISPLIW